jgi:translation initiation factor eIF-2B subunit beta
MCSFLQLCPQYQAIFNSQLAPSADVMFVERVIPDEVEALSPEFDYLPPKLVSLLITNSGSVKPQHIDRLLCDNYDRQDFFLAKKPVDSVIEEEKTMV